MSLITAAKKKTAIALAKHTRGAGPLKKKRKFVPLSPGMEWDSKSRSLHSESVLDTLCRQEEMRRKEEIIERIPEYEKNLLLTLPPKADDCQTIEIVAANYGRHKRQAYRDRTALTDRLQRLLGDSLNGC